MSLDLELLYVSTIVLLGALVLLLSRSWMLKLYREQRDRLDARQRFEAIHTATPVDDAASVARQRGFRSIEKTSTVTRRLAIPLVLTMVGFAAAIPFLDAIPATVFSLVVAGATVLIGIAARPFVENAIAGLAIASSRNLNIGDTIRIDGHYGTVEDITMTHTTVKIWDWRRYVVPNARMLNREFENYSLFDKHIWAHVEFWVEHGADLKKVEEVALASPVGSKFYNATESPSFWVMAIEKDTIKCWVAAWTRTPADAWSLAAEMRSRISTGLANNGIRPHRVVWEGAPPVNGK